MNPALSSFPTKIRLCLALIVAALGTDIFDRSAYLRIWRAVSLWWGALKPNATVPDSLYRARIETCRRCPIFYHRLQTCGTPLKTELRELGCWCNMETKAKLVDATCWIDDELGTDNKHGWIAAGLAPGPSAT